jgi:hypothetical protein
LFPLAEHGDIQNLREQLELQAREIQRLQGKKTTINYQKQKLVLISQLP